MSSCTLPPTSAPAPLQPLHSEAGPEAKRSRVDRIAQMLLLVMLYAVPPLIAAHTAAVDDPDLWWHLRTGEWIVQHRCVPHSDPFSGVVAAKPWAAYSWLFDLLMFDLFRLCGIVGSVVYTSGLLLAITAAIHNMVRRLQRDFSIAVLLTFAACVSFGHLYTPRPWLLSILFFIIELHVLMHVRRTGLVRQLAYVPFLFLLWANLHIQFVDGLVVLALATAESTFARKGTGASARVRAAMLATAPACVLATLCNPYGWHIYRVAYDLAAQPGVLNKVQELHAIPFRDLSDWSVLALAMAAVAALAWTRRLLPFETALLAFAVVLGFRSQRDVWLVATSAAAILASQISLSREAPQIVPASRTPFLIAAASIVVLIGFRAMSLRRDRLDAQVTNNLPVGAVEFVQARHFPGPVYNDYAWGGYLIWKLRLPVSMDGRAALYGDRLIDRSDATWSGQPDWASDPNLKSAHLVIGPVRAPLTQILRLDTRFRLAYEDKLAAVFVRREPAAVLP